MHTAVILPAEVANDSQEKYQIVQWGSDDLICNSNGNEYWDI